MLVAVAIAVLGSGNLRWFDAALVGYLFGTLSAIFAVIYRYLIWLSLQVFLLTVGLDALLADDDGLAWVTAGLSVVLAAGSAASYRYLR